MRAHAMRGVGLRALVAGLLASGLSASGISLAQEAPSDDQYVYDESLADAPWLLGDFFGERATMATVGIFFGEAVQQTIASGSAFANDDFHMIDPSTFAPKITWVGGPAGLVAGSFFTPSQPVPPADVVTGLSANGIVDEEFTAVRTDATADVFDSPADASPIIDDGEVFNIFQVKRLLLPGPNVADVVGRVRLLDNNMALPRDRVFFDYNYFHNVPLTASGIGVNRFEPGIEKTFLRGLTSIEVRVPMAITLNSKLAVDAPIDTSHYELGNMVIAPKVLLSSNESMALGAGFGVAIPTADDIKVSTIDGQELLKISNDSVHLIPYLAFLYAPAGSAVYAHSFLGMDVDANGASVSANVEGTGLQKIGEWNDQHLISASAAMGYWAFRSPSPRDLISGLALTTEVHYTATVNDADQVAKGAFIIGDPTADLSLVNATVGGHVVLPRAIATAGYTFPVTSDDRVFDGQFRTFINWYY